VLQHLELAVKRPLYAGRPASAATATGLLSRHTQEQKTLLQQALSG
jgi:2-oxoglutarate dehydrogenase E1 component